MSDETQTAKLPNGSIEKVKPTICSIPTPAEKSRLLQLANTIQAQVAEIQNYLTETTQPNPRFEGTAEKVDFSGVDETRSACIENLTELQDLLLTPKELLHAQTPTNLLSRHAIDRFRIARLIPLDGSRTYEELAWATMLPVKLLRRILRHAMSQRIFYETQPGKVAHTQASCLLVEDSSTRDYFGTVCQEVWPAATRTCDAIETWPGSKERRETGYFLAYGRTLEETLERDSVKRARYDNAMAALKDGRSFSLEHVVHGYDWAALGEATVVDVGGGVSTTSKALAKAFPKLRFVVQDRADVIANAVVDDPKIKDRIEFTEHDIFQEQAVKDAAVYFLRRVLMEKTDTECVEIFKALKPALKIGAVVLVQDPIVPDPGSCPIWQERKFRESDMLALAIANHDQREIDEWKGAFKQLEPGFAFRGVTMVPNSDIAFVEAVWKGESNDSGS